MEATHRRHILAYTSLGHFVNDGNNFFVPVIAAILTAQRGFSASEIVALFAVFYTSISLTSPYVGRLADVTGQPELLLSVGTALMGGGLVGFYFVIASLSGFSALVVTLASSFLMGFGGAFYHPLGATILQKNWGPEGLGMALGINGAMGSLGRALYPVVYYFAALALVTGSYLLGFAAISFISAIVILEATRYLRERSAPATPATPGAAREALTRGVVILTILTLVRFMATQGIIAWLPTYMVVAHTIPEVSLLGLYVTIIYAGGIFGQPLFGYLTRSFDGRMLFGASTAATMVAALGYLDTSGIVADVMLFLLGFFAFSAFPMLMTLSKGYVNERSSSLANSLIFGLGNGAGNTLGPLLVGLFATGSYTNLTLGFYGMTVLGIASAASMALLPPAGHGAKAPLFH